MKFGFIGAGKVGFSLGKYLAINNQQVAGYYSEFNEDAVKAAEFTQTNHYSDLKELIEDSDVLFLTVTDSQIENVWNQLKLCHIKNKIVCHCSGALSSEVFSGIAKQKCFGYSIHPLFAVSGKYESYKELSSSYFTIEGSPEKLDTMRKVFTDMGNNVCVIKKEDKVKYHAAAAMASNLVVGVINASENLLKECGFDNKSAHEALSSIIRGNVEHIINDGTIQALTGPIERNDVTTVKKHLLTLEGNNKEIYKAVSREIVEIAKEKNNNNYKEMTELLNN